jgi:LysR family hydrogen peroxide-inducible transcriptional activator
MPSLSLAGLSLRDLEYAVAVADLHHFGRAAERCGVSQAGLSEQVRKLEGLLGVTLFERTTRRITVTSEGEALLRQAREILGAARALLQTAQRRTGPLDGPVRLGAIATLGPYYLPDLLREVRAAFPRLELKVEEGRTEALTQALQAGKLDLVLLSLPLDANGVCTTALFFEPFRAVLPAQHRLSARKTLSMRDLACEGLLLLEEGHCLRHQILSLCATSGGGQASRFASSLEMLRHMIAAGEGFSLLPMLAMRGREALGGLVDQRDLHGEEVGRTIGLAWRGSDPRAASFHRFASFLRSTAPDGTQPVAEAQDAGRTTARATSETDVRQPQTGRSRPHGGPARGADRSARATRGRNTERPRI